MLNKSTVKKVANGSQPDDFAASFRREGTAIALGCTEPLSGTTHATRTYATLKDMCEFQHTRTSFISDLTTIMALSRLPDGKKLEVNVTCKTELGSRVHKETVGIIGFWKLADKTEVENITLTTPKPIIVNLNGARISEVIVDDTDEGKYSIQSAVTLEGHQRFSIKTSIPLLFSGNSCSYEIKQLRPGLPFAYAVTEGQYEPLDLISCPGRREYQSKERDLFLCALCK